MKACLYSYKKIDLYPKCHSGHIFLSNEPRCPEVNPSLLSKENGMMGLIGDHFYTCSVLMKEREGICLYLAKKKHDAMQQTKTALCVFE